MANVQTQVASTPAVPMTTIPAPTSLEDPPLPPPKETFSKLHQQRQASELRRLYRHIHPELRKNLAEAVAEDLAEVLSSEEPTEGDVQCMRWIFENWRLDAIGSREPPAAKEPVPGGNVQGTSRKFEEGSFASPIDREPTGPRPSGGDVRAARELFESKPLDELSGREEEPQPTAKEPAAGGDVRGTRMLFETRPLDRLGSRPSTQEQSPLELRSEIQELKGDVKKTVKLFQTEPLCAIQDAEGAIHEVRAACREEIQSNAVRTARWLFETRPLDAFNQDPSQVRVIRGISLEEGARPDVSATRWIFETQPLDAIREILVDEKDFQPSPDLVPPGPDVQQQRRLFETRALDTLKGDEDAGAEAPPKEEVVPGDVRSTLWLFETKPLDALGDKVQVGHLQRVGQQQGDGLVRERPALPLSQDAPQGAEVKGDVKSFKNLFETLPLDSIGQGETPASKSVSSTEMKDPAGQCQGAGSPVYAMQDSQGQLHALTSVSREQVVGGDVQGYRWMFETQPLDRLGRSPSTVDVVRGITRQEVVAGDVGTARWLFETQPLETIHQQERGERQEEERKGQEGPQPQPEAPPKGDVQTIRWLFETCPMSELAERQGSEVTEPTNEAGGRCCTWMFKPQSPDGAEGPGQQRLQVSQVQAAERQTDGHVFETEPLQTEGRPCGRRPVRYCSRVEIPSGQVSRRKEVFQALEAGQTEEPGSRRSPEPIPAGSVHKFTWLFENCPLGSLAAESVRGDGLQEQQAQSPPGIRKLDRQETAAEGTLRTLHATPGILHHGGILIESRGPGELCLARFTLPPCVRKEELVHGELPRIVRQVLHRPDVDSRGVLVQEDPRGQLRLRPLRLPAPGNGNGSADDMDPELQQLLACGLGASAARTGLVMQETEQGLVALTAYSLQPQLNSTAPERRSVQLLASCIDKGDLSGLHSLRWEPPADPSPVPAGEGTREPPPNENIIHVPPLNPSMEMERRRGPGAAGKADFPAREATAPTPLPDAKEQANGGSHTGQKGAASLSGSGEAVASPAGAEAPDLNAAMQSLRAATAEARSLHQQVLNRHKQACSPAAPSAPVHGHPPRAPAPAPGAPQSRPVAGGDSRSPAAPRKVSGEQQPPPRGLPGGWGTIQDGVYTAHPARAFDPPKGGQPSEKEPQPGGTARGGPDRSPGPGQEAACGQTAETTPRTAPLAHPLASEAQAAGAHLHSHNASVPPPPPSPAAVTGPDCPAHARHHEDSRPPPDPLPHTHGGPAGPRTPGGSQTKTPKVEPAVPPRKKPQVPPKPAHLTLTSPPRKLPTPSALSPSCSSGGGQGRPRPGEMDAATPPPAQVPPNSGQAREPLARRAGAHSNPQPPYSLSAVAPRPTGGGHARSPADPQLKAHNSAPTAPQRGLGPPGQRPVECSKQGAPESPGVLQGSQQEQRGPLSQVQALEQEAGSSVDRTAPQRLLGAAPLPGGAAPHKSEASVELAFGELTRVSAEVARLKEQTLARLLDIEEAVHKALCSVSSLQPEAHPGGHCPGPQGDRSVASSRARPRCSDQEVEDPPAAQRQAKAECHTEDEGQARVRKHTEVRGQAAPAAPPTRRPETPREETSLPPAVPSGRNSAISPTCISSHSAPRMLPEASSQDISGTSRRLAQDVGQAPMLQDKELYEEVDQFGNTVLPHFLHHRH